MNFRKYFVSGLLWSTCIFFSLSLPTTAQLNYDLNFNGDWSYDKAFDAFKGFTTKHGNSKKDSIFGIVTFSIADELNNNPDPSPEQIATYKFISENQKFIRSILLDSSKVYFTEYFEMLEGEEWVTEKEKADIAKMDLIHLMSPQRLHILKEHKDGYAYFGIGGHCIWELDEGFGFLLHKNRIITADVIFVAYETYPAQIDNGTYVEPQTVSQYGTKIPPKPTLYKPHPKYGKLKPIEKSKNICYVYDLVRYGYIDEVKELHNEGKIELQRSSYNLVKAAVRYNHLDLLKFFLSKKPEDKSGLLHEASRNKNKEMVQLLLDEGSDINEIVHTTPLDCVRRSYFDTLITVFPIDDDEFISWMKELGAKTIEEIIYENIQEENGVKLKSMFGNNHSLEKDTYIQYALHANKPEMAEIIFSTYQGHDAFLIKKAASFKSESLLSYCLN